jgi:hypothetical protein
MYCIQVDEDGDGFKAVAYSRATVLLAQAVRELTGEIRRELSDIKERVKRLEDDRDRDRYRDRGGDREGWRGIERERATRR